TALIRLTYVEGMDKQSCPAIVCCGGRMDLHGAPLNRSWVKLGKDVQPGDVMIKLAEPVTGWKVGDQVIITATDIHTHENKPCPTERRAIQSITGDAIILDSPLEHSHQGDGEFRGEVANLSRNVIVESAVPDGVRGHTMYHRGSTGSLTYAEF